MSRDESGQTLLEFVLVLPVLAAAIAGTFWLLRATSLRTECSRVVFESVRSAINQSRSENASVALLFDGVTLRRTDAGVEGWKKCGTHVERLFLPYLGKRKPGA